MQKVLWSALLFLLGGVGVFGQNFYQQPLKDVLTSTKSNTYIAVEGYYVDNSSFMVIHSSDKIVEENRRYPVYEYKYHLNLHTKNSTNMAEMPVLIQRAMQGEKCPRILFLNKKWTTSTELVLDELAMPGMPIVGDLAKYVQPSEGKTFTVSLPDLRDFLFSKGAMPTIEEETNSEI